MNSFLEHLGETGRAVLAVAAGVLPRRYWSVLLALPIRRFAIISALATMALGWAIFVPGFMAYSERVGTAMAKLTIEVAERQLKGELPQDERLNIAPIQASAFTPIAFAFLTPIGLVATYLIFSAFARIAACVADDAIGDPVLTGVDAVIHRTVTRARERQQRRVRERQEGAEVPDRLYTGDWAGLAGVDFVVVSSRRKPEWDEGGFVITSEKWYTLGAPFERQLPDGLRTIYPLTEQTRNDVLRRGVRYELPPLSRAKRALADPREPRR